MKKVIIQLAAMYVVLQHKYLDKIDKEEYNHDWIG